jgi:hypothetical protein
MMLFNLANDVAESRNLSEEKQSIVSKLSARMLDLDAEIEKNARKPWFKE